MPIMENPSSSMRDVNTIIDPELQRRCLRSPVARPRFPERMGWVSKAIHGPPVLWRSPGHTRERQASLVVSQRVKCRAAQAYDSERRTYEDSNKWITLDL